jgi:hypothetical protein
MLGQRADPLGERTGMAGNPESFPRGGATFAAFVRCAQIDDGIDAEVGQHADVARARMDRIVGAIHLSAPDEGPGHRADPADVAEVEAAVEPDHPGIVTLLAVAIGPRRAALHTGTLPRSSS